jgi:hypothetical protein
MSYKLQAFLVHVISLAFTIQARRSKLAARSSTAQECDAREVSSVLQKPGPKKIHFIIYLVAEN